MFETHDFVFVENRMECYLPLSFGRLNAIDIKSQSVVKNVNLRWHNWLYVVCVRVTMYAHSWLGMDGYHSIISQDKGQSQCNNANNGISMTTNFIHIGDQAMQWRHKVVCHWSNFRMKRSTSYNLFELCNCTLLMLENAAKSNWFDSASLHLTLGYDLKLGLVDLSWPDLRLKGHKNLHVCLGPYLVVFWVLIGDLKMGQITSYHLEDSLEVNHYRVLKTFQIVGHLRNFQFRFNFLHFSSSF